MGILMSPTLCIWQRHAGAQCKSEAVVGCGRRHEPQRYMSRMTLNNVAAICRLYQLFYQLIHTHRSIKAQTRKSVKRQPHDGSSRAGSSQRGAATSAAE
jgi:hypothetical protein